MAKSAEQLALEEYLKAGKDFTAGGAAQYQEGADLDYTQLGDLDQLGPSAYNGIQTDSRYKDNEMEALRQLEEQSKDGYSARDKADLARIEGAANRANKGRQGAVKQNLAARGIGGGGLEVVMAQQAAQDAAEQEALASLEKNAQMQDRKQQATSQLGQLSSQLQSRDYNQQAQAAQANDAISRFNTQNANNVQTQNNQGINQTNQTNYNRANEVADNNVNAGYTYRKDALGVQQGGAKVQYDAASAAREAAEQRARDRKAKSKGVTGAVMGAVGAGAGAFFGGPAGASAGYAVGNGLGQAFAHGGRVEGPELSPFDDPANDIIPATLSAGEVVLPKSVARDPQAAAQFVAKQNSMDPRILERLSAKNPDLVSRYKAQFSEADQGVEDAQDTQDMVGYAGVLGKGLTDFNNSQKDSYRTGVTFDNMHGKVHRDPDAEFDNSGSERLAQSGSDRAKAKLAEIKANMARDYGYQKDDDAAAAEAERFAMGRADKASADQESQRRFDAEFGLKKSGQEQSARQFQQTLGNSSQALNETSRHNQVTESNAAIEAKAKAASTGAGKQLNGEQQSRYDSAAMGLKALGGMKAALANGDNTFSLVGDNDFTKNSRVFEEALGRMQSGGAIQEEEAERFRKMAPTKWDSAEMQQQKLADLEAEMGARIQSMGKDPAEAVALRTPGSSAPAFDFDAEDRRRGLK